jgi:Heparinase II/III-like protein
MEGWRTRLRGALARCAFRAFPSLASRGLEIAAAELGSPCIPAIFSGNLREVPPALNDDLLDLYGRSEQVLANRFCFRNRLKALEAEFDWQGEAELWLRELHSFDYALDLAMTYRISREQRYARHLRYLIAHWIASNPPGQGAGWQAAPLARRVRNWILAADLARDDWEQDTEFAALLAGSLGLQAAFLERNSSAADFIACPLEGARALLLAWRFFNGSESLRTHGWRQALETFERSLADDGGYAPPRPGLQLRLAENALECLLACPAEESPDRLRAGARRILAFLEGMLLPDGTLPGFGPDAGADPERLSDLFALAAVNFDEPRWKSLAGKFGILPYLWLGEEGKARFERLEPLRWEAPSCAQPASGLYRLRGAERSALLINGHAPHSRSGHQDYSSYELFVAGRRLIVDCGDLGEEGDFFSSPQAHNLLLVEGRAPRSGARSARGCWRFDGAVTGVWLPEDLYGSRRLTHRRAWFCLEGRAWVVLDWLRGAGAVRLANLLHFYPTFEVELKGSAAEARSRSWVSSVAPLGPPATRLATARGEGGLWTGWYAPAAGVKYPAGVLAIETDSARLPWLGGYLIASETGRVTSEADPAQGTVQVNWQGKTYRLSMNPQEGACCPEL